MMVPQEFQRVIKEQNYYFTQELTKYQVDKMVQQIKEKYQTRWEKLSSIINQRDPSLQTDLINFNTYLISKCNKVQLAKW